jgi:archaemetzincin
MSDVAFTDTTGFERLPAKPQPGDWLDRFPEPGQTFEQYERSRPNRPTSRRRTIYLLPIGQFTEGQAPDVERLRRFTEIFFGLPAKVLPSQPLPERPTRPRRWGGRRWTQYRTDAFLDRLLPRALPRDGFCLVGVTMGDLYPNERWNYVFGIASLRDRVGIFSFVRYYPQFWGQPDTPAARTQALRRSLKVLAHEIGHMFGMQHCIAWRCGMNGSNHLEESDRRPIHFCPVCLRKLAWNVGLDARARCRDLASFYSQAGLKREAGWVQRRLKVIGGSGEAPTTRKMS